MYDGEQLAAFHKDLRSSKCSYFLWMRKEGIPNQNLVLGDAIGKGVWKYLVPGAERLQVYVWDLHWQDVS
jgi:hypothetical protein